MATVRPFQFTGLPHYTRDQIALEATLSTYLSSKPYAPGFATELGALLERYLKISVKLSPPELKSVLGKDLSTLLPEVSCIVVLGAAPGDQKIIVDLDMGMTSCVIERLLGGPGDGDRVKRPLTEIEEGVLSFLLLKLLTYFQDGLQHGGELALVLDCFASKASDLGDRVQASANYLMLGIRVGLDKHVGYARIFFPAQLVNDGFGKLVPQDNAPAGGYAYMARVLDSLGELHTTARVEAATLNLDSGDRSSLERGDIVILEQHELEKTPEGFGGAVLIKLGEGRNGSIRARLLSGDPVRVEVMNIVVQEEPAEAQMGQEGSPEAGENLAETEGLLRDVPSPVVVELGRMRMNAAQVARLKQGQILRLPRGQNDPVDLVVNGKLFARGELIEVDGELGVRLTHVVGAS